MSSNRSLLPTLYLLVREKLRSLSRHSVLLILRPRHLLLLSLELPTDRKSSDTLTRSSLTPLLLTRPTSPLSSTPSLLLLHYRRICVQHHRPPHYDRRVPFQLYIHDIGSLPPVQLHSSDFSDWLIRTVDRRAELRDKWIEYWSQKLQGVQPLVLTLAKPSEVEQSPVTQIEG